MAQVLSHKSNLEKNGGAAVVRLGKGAYLAFRVIVESQVFQNLTILYAINQADTKQATPSQALENEQQHT